MSINSVKKWRRKEKLHRRPRQKRQGFTEWTGRWSRSDRTLGSCIRSELTYGDAGRAEKLRVTGRWCCIRSHPTGCVRSDVIKCSPSVRSLSSDTASSDNRTGHCLQRPVTFRASVRSTDRRCTLTATTDQTLSLSVRSLRDQSPVHSIGPFSSPFLHRVDPHQLQLHLLCKCANTIKCTPPCVCVLAFSQSFSKGLATQLATPLNPSDDGKLDHLSGT